MNYQSRVLFGPLATVILCVGVAVLGLMVPGYSQVRQTVSEIGEVGSPARVPFAVMLCIVALCILVFAFAMRDISVEHNRSSIGAYLTAFMAVSVIGTGIFAFPLPLHNVFGISELIGYHAPLATALTWRHDNGAKRVVAFSWFMSVLVFSAIALNLVTLARQTTIWAYVKPFYGVVQRTMFASWFGWCFVTGLLMYSSGSSKGGASQISSRG
jgi:hypothetical membrane protein